VGEGRRSLRANLVSGVGFLDQDKVKRRRRRRRKVSLGWRDGCLDDAASPLIQEDFGLPLEGRGLH